MEINNPFCGNVDLTMAARGIFLGWKSWVKTIIITLKLFTYRIKKYRMNIADSIIPGRNTNSRFIFYGYWICL